MKLKFIKGFIKLYRKWVLRECPHICLLCKFKDTCKEDNDWWSDINNLVKYKER